jgi:hypothetical protein
MDNKRINSAARKALIAANPGYYAWPESKQEAFRASLDGAEYDRARVILLRELCDIQCAENEVDEAWDEIPESRIDIVNQVLLLLRGIGDDHIFLNESLPDGVTLLDFVTLYDYDYDNHLFQESANEKDFEDYPGKDYYALRFSLWARLNIQDALNYATLYSLADYIGLAIQEQGNAAIDRLIPHEYKEGKDFGKADKNGFVWDMKLDAGGFEPQLDELRTRWYQYLEDLWLDLSREFRSQPATVYAHKNPEQEENDIDYIFANETTLRKVRWRHFLADCKPLLCDFAVVEDRIKMESDEARLYLEQEHQDIMRNFDPKIVKLRKKRKVIIAPGALDGLMDE